MELGDDAVARRCSRKDGGRRWASKVTYANTTLAASKHYISFSAKLYRGISRVVNRIPVMISCAQLPGENSNNSFARDVADLPSLVHALSRGATKRARVL